MIFLFKYLIFEYNTNFFVSISLIVEFSICDFTFLPLLRRFFLCHSNNFRCQSCVLCLFRFATNFCRMLMDPKNCCSHCQSRVPRPLHHIAFWPLALANAAYACWPTCRCCCCGFCCLTVGRKNINDATALLKHTFPHLHI